MSDKTLHVNVYTDGGCDPNPGPGGWAAIIRFDDHEWVLTGNDPDTTNNRMELLAATSALALLASLVGPCRVTVHTDSEYLRLGITEWIEHWKTNGWLTQTKEPVKNQDLWQQLLHLTQTHQVEWQWLRGHSGHTLNERADRLATQSRKALRRTLGSAAPPQPRLDSRPQVEICVKASGPSEGKPGTWAAVLRSGEHTRSITQVEPGLSVNALLIRAATAALRALTKPCQVTLYSDAEYLIQGASSWLSRWQASGWKTKEGKAVANRAEWEALLEAMQPHQVTWLLAQGQEVPADLNLVGQLASQAGA